MSIDGYTGSAITTHQGNPRRGKTCKQVVWCAHVSVLQVEGPGVTKMKRKNATVVVGTGENKIPYAPG